MISASNYSYGDFKRYILKYCCILFITLLPGLPSLSGQANKKKAPINWQMISKLVVPPGQSFQLKSRHMQIDTLIMLPSSRIWLAQGDNILMVDHAEIASQATIIGRGKNGANGSNGRSGEPAPRLPGARNGGRGSSGTPGGAAPNLKFYLGSISYKTPLTISLTGGNGGNGGNGGDGGTVEVSCGDRRTKGTNGGDAGQGGFGGAGGELFLVLEDGISKSAINYKSTAGKTGQNGEGGRPGLLRRKCVFQVRESRPGIPGSRPTFFVTPSKPNTNADFLEFPDPVPKPSGQKLVPINVPPGSSFATVEAKLRSALSTCGYENLNYRMYKGGFVIFTGIEHITNEGIPLTGTDRFSPEPVIFYNDPSFISFLESLLTARKGYSRIIVFIISDEGISTRGSKVERSEVLAWLTEGIDELPTDIGKRPFTNQHKVKALIYEFSKRENSAKPVFSTPKSIIPIEKHLNGSSLWSLLIAE